MTNPLINNRKQALVTGGTQGIGLAIAEGLAAEGWQVTAVGLELPQSLKSREGVTFVQGDVTQDDTLERCLTDCPRLDALVNAAGTIARQEEFQVDTFRRVIEVNLIAAMRVSTACHQRLAESRGGIVNVASMLSFFGGGLVPAYSASKGGVAQLTKSLAIAWAQDGIRVNAIAPGWIETGMTAALRQSPERHAAIIQRTPMRRWGQPGELVGPVLFLLSPAASFVTGSILTVDGGYSCY